MTSPQDFGYVYMLGGPEHGKYLLIPVDPVDMGYLKIHAWPDEFTERMIPLDLNTFSKRLAKPTYEPRKRNSVFYPDGKIIVMSGWGSRRARRRNRHLWRLDAI